MRSILRTGATARSVVFAAVTGLCRMGPTVPLGPREVPKSRLELTDLDVAFLPGGGGPAPGEGAVRVLDPTLPLALLREEQVAQDREQPGVQVPPDLKAVGPGPRPHRRVLHQLLGAGRGVRRRQGEAAQ